MTFFSVVIPLYNKAPYVERTIKSVLEQTFRDFELTVIDNGSTDGSSEIVSAFNDSRLRLCHLETNTGVSNARNLGVSMSSAPYVAFLDADDWWEPTFLEEMAGLIRRHPDAGIYGTKYYIVRNKQKKEAPIEVDKTIGEGEINYCQVYAKTLCMPLWTGAVCIPRTVFDTMNGFRPDLTLGEDLDLWIRITLKNKSILLNKPLSNYNQDADSAYRSTQNKNFNPDTFVTFHFDQFEEEEKRNPDLKLLLDRIRVYSLMNFREKNLFPDKVRHEIAKVNFSNVKPIYRLYYHAPYGVVRALCGTKKLLSSVKRKILK